MKILFDHQAFQLQKYGGISRYFANLNNGLNEQSSINSRIALLYADNAYVQNQVSAAGKVFSGYFEGHAARIEKWNRRYSRWAVRSANYDVFHPTYFHPYFLKYIRKPFVVTVHDMIYERMPERFNAAAMHIDHKKQLIQKADALIAISEYTRQEILNFYPGVENKITVVHHGYILKDNHQAETSNTQIPARYILYIGERWLYKNFSNFIKGVAALLRADDSLKLVCAGGGAFTADEELLLQSLNIRNQCHQYNVSDAELKQLYVGAQLFAFPSMHEGFGLPLLEAFANNCPVVCSNTSCMPEIAGNAALYFNPAEPDSIGQAVAQVLGNAGLRQELKNKGQQRLALFSFDACVQNTLNVYQSVL